VDKLKSTRYSRIKIYMVLKHQKYVYATFYNSAVIVYFETSLTCSVR